MDMARLILEYIQVLIWPFLLVIGSFLIYRRFKGQLNELLTRVLKGQEYELRIGRAALRVQVVEQAVKEAIVERVSPELLADPERLRKTIAEAASRIVQLLGISRDEMKVLKELHLIEQDIESLKGAKTLQGLSIDMIVQVLEAKRLVEVDRRGPGSNKIRLAESGLRLVAKHRVYSGLVEGTLEEEIASGYDAEMDAYYSDLAASMHS